MKKNLLFLLVGIVAMLTSCNKEDVGGLATNKTASFNVSVESGVQTRAAVDDLTRYVMEVYKGATATGTPVVHIEQATGVFSDILIDAPQYTILFWADYGIPSTDGTHNTANEYNATDLKAARVAANKKPTKDAYSGVSKFTVGVNDESVYTAVTLTHAVSQVNFVQIEDLTSTTNELVVSYPESYSLNVENNAVTKIDGAITHTFNYNKKEKGILGTSYIIAATGAPKTVLEISATLNSETTKAVSNVPFERNFRTIISGAYSSKYEAALAVTCDDAWGASDNEAVIPVSYAIGYLYPNTIAPIGVVFWVDESDPTYDAATKTSTKGKIVSLDQATDITWSTESIVTGATSDTDGADNTSKVLALSSYTAASYPAFAWCADKNITAPAGISWYIPAKEELKALYGKYNGNVNLDNSVKTVVTLSLNAASATPLLGYYWSSSEFDGNFMWTIDFIDGFTKSEAKRATYIRVRAVSTF